MSWPLVRLSEVAEINPRCPKDIDESQTVSFVAMASVSEEGNLLNEEPRTLGDTKKGFTYFQRSDVLLAKITPCFENGKSLKPNSISHDVGFGSTEFHVLRAKEEVLDPSYLFYMVWSKAFRFLGEHAMSGAAGQRRVGAEFLKKHSIPLPPLAEQKRIAAILDKADAIRQKRKQAIDLADEFLRSVFLDMFGDPTKWNSEKGRLNWATKTIKEVCPLKRGYDLPTKSRVEGNVPIFAANGMNGSHNEPKVKGPGVITGRSGTIGKVVYTDKEYWPLNTALYVTDFCGNNPKYIEWFLRLFKLERYAQGAGVPTLNRNLFLEEKVYVPSLDEQNKFSGIAEKLEAFACKLSETQDGTLFHSVSQKAFSGEL
ncbi:restriction endonuclease subunit S [Paraferrimonas haliotis]|uniref:restriction endonuclease subunit S n=1 Tax=Paraferrimonas haliotis TaxID=2013866 RepID=UPI000BA90C5A|nr:restriction endonuclease subunit S [Paraferrimonas haliotis]